MPPWQQRILAASANAEAAPQPLAVPAFRQTQAKPAKTKCNRWLRGSGPQPPSAQGKQGGGNNKKRPFFQNQNKGKHLTCCDVCRITSSAHTKELDSMHINIQLKPLTLAFTNNQLSHVCLIDTGSALSYGSPAVRDQLLSLGYQPQKIEIRACSPVADSCQIISELFNVVVSFTTEQLAVKDLSLALHILPSLSVKHDFSIIIGLKDIRASHLVLDFPSRFNIAEDLALEGAQVESVYTQLIDSTVKSTYTPLVDNTQKTDIAYTPLAQSGPTPNLESKVRSRCSRKRKARRRLGPATSSSVDQSTDPVSPNTFSINALDSTTVGQFLHDASRQVPDDPAEYTSLQYLETM
jgi:hypothetical protein